MGLLRVVGRSSEPSLSQTAVSLTLGGAGQPTAPTPVPTPMSTPKVLKPAVPSPTRRVPVTSPVAVINASGIQGLAARAAALLRTKGVTVATVGNLTGARKPFEGTIYFPPGLEAQAHTLAGLSGISAVAAAPTWLPADGRLVLVVTS
jgi:hypothetical protein